MTSIVKPLNDVLEKDQVRCETCGQFVRVFQNKNRELLFESHHSHKNEIMKRFFDKKCPSSETKLGTNPFDSFEVFHELQNTF